MSATRSLFRSAGEGLGRAGCFHADRIVVDGGAAGRVYVTGHGVGGS